MHDSEEMLHAAVAAGASAYLLKSDAEELLLTALNRLEEDQHFVSPTLHPKLAKHFWTKLSTED
jgi:DNA-binding NarL/FixJ family response regulator